MKPIVVFYQWYSRETDFKRYDVQGLKNNLIFECKIILLSNKEDKNHALSKAEELTLSGVECAADLCDHELSLPVHLPLKHSCDFVKFGLLNSEELILFEKAVVVAEFEDVCVYSMGGPSSKVRTHFALNFDNIFKIENKLIKYNFLLLAIKNTKQNIIHFIDLNISMFGLCPADGFSIDRGKGVGVEVPPIMIQNLRQIKFNTGSLLKSIQATDLKGMTKHQRIQLLNYIEDSTYKKARNLRRLLSIFLVLERLGGSGLLVNELVNTFSNKLLLYRKLKSLVKKIFSVKILNLISTSYVMRFVQTMIGHKARTFVPIDGPNDFSFVLRPPQRDGSTAMLRVKNEADNIIRCLESIKEVFDEIVIVDNGSSDETLRKVHEFKARHEYLNIYVFEYPYAISRCGPEHFSTNEFSVHSLSYYYNYCLSKCETRLVVKWDADMIIKPGCHHALKGYLSKFTSKSFFGYAALRVETKYYNKGEQISYEANEINTELRGFSKSPRIVYLKGNYFEVLKVIKWLPRISNTRVYCEEIKDIGADEFSHWSTQQFPTQRKINEFRNHLFLREKFLS